MFKIGDRVICTNSYQASKLIINQKYIVKDIILFPIENKYYYELDDLNAYFLEDRFKLDITQQRKEKLNKLCLK